MADGRPPPPYAESSDDFTFDYDPASRTYGLRFLDDDPREDTVIPESDVAEANTGQAVAKGPPSAFWLALHRRRALADSSKDDQSQDVIQSISFLDLPAEIRNYIYELESPLRGFATTFMALGSCLIPPPLAKSNSQVRREMLPIFYSNNTFSIPLNKAHEDRSLRCLELIAPNAHLLKDVRSIAAEAHNKSWNVRFSMSIKDNGKCITFSSPEPLTEASQQTIARVLLTSKALRMRPTFTGDDFCMFFKMLRQGVARLEIDRGRADQRNAEHAFDIRPVEAETVLMCNVYTPHR